MAERDTDQHTADVTTEETQSADMDLSSDQCTQEKTDLALEQRDSKDGDTSEENTVPLTEKNSTPADGNHGQGDSNRQTAEEKPNMTDNESGVEKGSSPENEETDIKKNKTSHTQETPELTDPGVTENLEEGNSSSEEKDEDEGGADEETEDTSSANTEAEKNNESVLESLSEETEKETNTDTTDSGVTGHFNGGNDTEERKKESDEEGDQKNEHKGGVDGETDTNSTNTEAEKPKKIAENDIQEETVEKKPLDVEVETICATTGETTEPAAPRETGNVGGSRRFLIVGVLVAVVVAILMQHLLEPEAPPQKKDVRQIDLFLEQMEKVKTRFPHQRPELWNRSRIHLVRHLQTAQPTEPVSLILTAGVRAEKTLRCLAHGLASAFSSALNASVLHIDGASKASQDSDQVKLDIDSKLQGAFEGDKPVAVIHRFEELPPGSTLIFYRYCDHENAAYKKTGLIFTVLLGEEEEIPANSRLSTVEEMVDDHLQKKFLSDEYPVSFDRMDLDKYGGLWSRISHLILPVAAEERMEHEGC